MKDDNTMVSNSLQIPIFSLPQMERPPPTVDVYTSDNMTIIDTDATPQQVSFILFITKISHFTF